MPAKSKKKISSHTHFESPNIFGSLGSDMENEQKQEDRESKATLHESIDRIWKLLISNRKKFRSLIYQFLAAILIEKDGIEKEDGGLEELIESILIDPRMGDQHISKLPPKYRDKILLCIKRIFIEDKSIKGNVNKFSTFLHGWHSDLEKQIKDQLGDNYKIKVGLNNDGSDEYVINPQLRKKIKDIIINNSEAKKLRDEFHLSAHTLKTEEKVKEIKPKTGLDHYLDYLLAEDEVRSEESLNEAVRLGYVEDESENKKQGAVVCEEYYFKMANKYYDKKNYKLIEKILVNGAKKKSPAAEYFLSIIYEVGLDGIIGADQAKSIQYCKLSAAQGFAPAEHNLAHNYLLGLCGIKKDTEEALRLFRKVAGQGYTYSQNDLGCIYNGDYGNVVQKNNQTAITWWKMAIEQGSAHGKNSLGKHYIENGNINEGIQLVTEAAEEGLALAQHNLGSYYLRDDIVAQDTYKGITWLESAAKQNFAESIKCLAENKSSFDMIRKGEKYPKYYIRFIDPAFDIVQHERIDKTDELLEELGLDRDNTKKVAQSNWQGTKMPLSPDQLTVETMELLGIDRMKVDKINPEQQKALQLELPRITIEENPNDNSMFITWPINNKLKDREIIDKFTKESKTQPSTTAWKPAVKVMASIASGDRSQ